MENLMLPLFLLFFCSYFYVAPGSVQDFKESLLLKVLPDGNILAHFEHATIWDDTTPSDLTQSSTVRHYGMFPRPVAEVVSLYKVNELHLSLTRGKWRESLWGYPPIDSPPGAELWAWFLPQVVTDVDKEWSGLLHSLSGLICASFDAVESSNTFIPLTSFKPTGPVIGNASANHLRYTALPREPVCTENLTPWSKLLPCGQKAGLGSLYSALKLYDTVYHSLSLNLLPSCRGETCSVIDTILIQTLSIVFKGVSKTWSISSLFDRRIRQACPLSSSSLIFVDLPSVRETRPLAQFNITHQKNTLAVYDIHNYTGDITVLSQRKHDNSQIAHALPLTIQRHLTGSGHGRGGIFTIISNNINESLNVSLLDMTPWYFRLLYHTLSCQVIINNEKEKNCKERNIILYHHYTPAKDRELPYKSEYILSLPPNSTVRFYVEFLRGFLKWNEYPPDASHGFFINSAVLTAYIEDCFNCTVSPTLSHNRNVLRIHSQPLLVSLPIPDFSMPYNVICFVSTVVAIGFGSLFNLTTKQLLPEGEEAKKGLLRKIIEKLYKKSP